MIHRRPKRRFHPYRSQRKPFDRLAANAAYKQEMKNRGLLKCEICGFFDPTVQPYFLIEVHHCKRVADGGGHDNSNRLLLCPTHHSLADRLSKQHRAINLNKLILISLIKEHEFERIYGANQKTQRTVLRE